MKINVSKMDLINGLKKVSSATGTKSTIAVLSNILVTAKNGVLTLKGADTDLSIKTDITAEIEVEGVTTIPAKKFNEIVAKLPEGNISISSDENFQCSINAAKCSFKIIGMNPNEFPDEKFSEENRVITLSRDLVVSSLRKISYAASDDNARPVLNGVLFSIREGVLTTVATDGRRMALVEKVIDGDESLDGDTVIPMKAVNELIKSLGGEGDVKIYFSENKTVFVTDKTVFSTHLVDGNYPNFRFVIPQAFNFSATIPRTDFIAALERVSLVLSESNLSIKVFFDKKSGLLQSSSTEVGKAEDTVQIDFNGEPMEITFNPKFLIGPLKNLDCDNLIIQINDAGSPVALSGDEGFLYVIMPMRN